MSNVDHTSESAAPVGARPSVEARPARAARPPRGGLLGLTVLLALLAVAGCAYLGWRQWRQVQDSASDRLAFAVMQQRVGAMETTLAGVSGERSSLSQRLNDAAQVNRSLREELLSQAERTRNLEQAVAKLAENSLSSHDAMLLDETESLLRMGDERYALFHDAQGAAAAYALADQTLAAVSDVAFSGVRQTIEAAHQALLRSQPASQAEVLQQLTELRGALVALPLKPLDQPATGGAADVWSRIRRALAGVITVRRDSGAPLVVADARFARELTALDLAQAQAALLAHDAASYAAALQRAEASLASQFEPHAAAVQQARATLRQLAAALPVDASVPLGAALVELRNLRMVHALSPNPAPAAAASSAAATGTKGRP